MLISIPLFPYWTKAQILLSSLLNAAPCSETVDTQFTTRRNYYDLEEWLSIESKLGQSSASASKSPMDML